MAQSTDSFVNQLWYEDVGDDDFINSFTGVDMKIYIYDNQDYDTYVTFLDGSEASVKVDEDTDYLTSSVLTAFQNYVDLYDSYSIRVKMGFDTELSVNNQAVAYCIAHEDFGISCGTASTVDDTSASEFRTYWFPVDDYDTIITAIKDDTPLDPWDSAYDSYMIDDYYYGLTQYYLRMASANTLVGDKFQYIDPSNEQQWANVKDYRFRAGETVSLYRLQ